MRSYDKSIALYERTRKTLAGGVSSNVRYAATPVPLFFERGEGARLLGNGLRIDQRVVAGVRRGARRREQRQGARERGGDGGRHVCCGSSAAGSFSLSRAQPRRRACCRRSGFVTVAPRGCRRFLPGPVHAALRVPSSWT